MIIGITGKSGSGKSYLSEILAQNLDMIHIDIDKISHKVLTFENTKNFLLKEFGSKIFDNEILNRKQLGTIVFSNPEKLEKLNKFCQIEIEKELDRIIKDSTKSIILDYALLVGLKQFELCDIKILLDADLNLRYSRVKSKENITKEYFFSRDNSLPNFDESKFNFIYKNISESEISFLIDYIKSSLKEQLWLEKPQ